MEELRLTSSYGKFIIIHRVSYISGGDRRISAINNSSKMGQALPSLE